MLLAALLAFATALHDPPIPDDTEVVTTASGLRYCVLAPGSEGPHPGPTDTVVVHYTGWLSTGKAFDTTHERAPARFRMGAVVPGWREGLALMTPGARFKLALPSALAYGERGLPPSIPPRADLVLELELVELLPGPPLPLFQRPDPAVAVRTAAGLVHAVLAQGAGEPPGPDEPFVLAYTSWHTSGELIASSALTGVELVTTSRRVSIPFLRELAPALRPGSRHLLEVPAQLGMASQRAPTVWLVELRRVLRVPPFAPSPPEALVTTASGLAYAVLSAGSGATARPGERVALHWTVWLADGTLVDTTLDAESGGAPRTVAACAGDVIAAFDEALALMRPGAILELRVPSALARGRAPAVPFDAALVCRLELVSIGG